METLKIVTDSNELFNAIPAMEAPAGCTADKTACMLAYLGSLDRAAEEVHGDEDNWRYGRYLFYGMVVAALKNAEVRS